jgi:ankyrin repeat protein
MYWPIHTELSHKLEEDAAAAKDLTQDVISFMFDEDWEPSLSFESWISNVRSLARILPREHSMKPALCAIPEGDFSLQLVLSLFGLDDILVFALSRIGGLNVNQQNEQGHTPVYLASAFGHSRTLETLINHGADVNVECGKYGSPLHVACFQGHLEVVAKLLHLGAQIYCGSVFKNALEAAFRGGNEDVALYLVNLSQNVESEDEQEEALEQAALLGFVKVVQRLQIARQVSPAGSKPEKMKRKVRKAIQGGQVGVLRQLLGRDATLSDYLPSAAVALATVHNQKGMIEFLLDQGLDLEAEWDFGSPLRTAALLNFQSIVRLLIARGAQVNAKGPLGAALQAAALNGHTSIVRLLIQEGADVNQSTGFYGSALQAASFHGHLDTVKLLIDSNADIYVRGYASSAMDAAARGGHEDVVVLILRKRGQTEPPVENPSCSLRTPEKYEELLREASTGRVQSQDLSPMRNDRGANKTMTAMECLFEAVNSDDPIDPLRMEYSSRFGSISEQWEEVYPLVAAASAGDGTTVGFLLREHQEHQEHQERLDVPDDRIRTCISVALKQGHLSVVHTLLDFLAGRAKTNGISSEVQIALELASGYLTAGEKKELASRFPELDQRHACHTQNTREKMLVDFDKLLAMPEVDVALEICGLHGLYTSAQLLSETPILRDRKAQSGKAAFVSAAESGYVDTMRLFISHWPEFRTIPEALGRALIESSKHGHIAAVRYLVLELGADVNKTSPRRISLRRVADQRFGFNHRFQDGPELDLQFLLTHRPMLRNERSVPVISPLQACLHGYADNPHSPDGRFREEESRKASQYRKEEVICFLLENGANPNDPGGQRVFPIQVAAKLCSTHILQSLILAGADVNKTFPTNPLSMPRSNQHLFTDGLCLGALFEAAGRELCGLPMLQRLVASGAAFPEDPTGQNDLLDQALKFFGRHHSPRGALFASSLDQVFTEGPGAVLFFLLAQMPQVKAIDTRWNLVLQMAAFSKQESFVELLLSRGANVNGKGYHYYGTALQAAARCGHTTLTQKLLDAGAEVNATGGAWHTALRAALVDGHETTAQLLLDHGANLERDLTRYGKHQPPAVESMSTLQLAARTGNADIVASILAIGADPLLDVLEDSQHPLIIAASKGAVQMVEALLNAGAPVNIHFKPSHQSLPVHSAVASPIHAASFAGQLDALILLIRSGADIESDFDESGTPLAAGASSGNVQVVRHLISAGATINDSEALENAVQHNHFEVVKVLLDSGATAKGAITLACSLGNLNIVKVLIETALESDPVEPVFDEAYSADGLSESMTRLLLEYGTPTTYQFLLACARSSLASVDLLLQEKTVDINQPDERSGDYPLQIAALHLRVELVQTLVSLGANVDCESPNHGTPLHTALKACAAPILRAMEGEGIRRILEQVSLPAPPRRPLCDSMVLPDEPKIQQKSECKSIAKYLIAQGANISRGEPFLGPPLHLACLLGMDILMASFLAMDQNLNSTAGHFEQPLFAVIQGRHPHVISLLLRRSSSLTHNHLEYGTALHHACRVRDGPSARLLLQQGADATVRDFRGQTPLTVALKREVDIRNSGISMDQDSRFIEHLLTSNSRRLRHDGREDQMDESTPLNTILGLAKRLHISDEDLTAAVELSTGRGYANKRYVLSQLLCMDSSRLTAHHRPAIDALEMVLRQDPSTRVTPRMFLHIFRTGSSPALRLLNLLESYGKAVYSTRNVQAAIDDAYNLESQAAIKKRFYGLLTKGEREWDSAGSESGWES